MKIVMQDRKAPQHYYWIRRAFSEIGNEVFDRWIADPSFSFGTDGCDIGIKVGVPSAYWTCHEFENRKSERDVAKSIDVMFIGSSEYLQEFKGINPKTYRLIPAADPKVYYPYYLEEKYDIGYCGYRSEEREKILDRLEKEGFSVMKHYSHSSSSGMNVLSFEEVNKMYAESRLGFNWVHPWGTTLNMKIFEILSMEKCLLTNKFLSEPDTTFQDRKHLVIYHNENELIDLVKYYLDHEEERKQIGKQGREEVLKKHTWNMRAEFVVEIMKKECGL